MFERCASGIFSQYEVEEHLLHAQRNIFDYIDNRLYNMFDSLVIGNPKRDSSARTGNASWYPYYAGFSPKFAYDILTTLSLASNAVVLDPWNGSGTTTCSSASLGFHSIGYDLNPVMVIAAKARALSRRLKSSLEAISKNILKSAKKRKPYFSNDDPLLTWIRPMGASYIRLLQNSINVNLISETAQTNLTIPENMNVLSDLAAFYYIALFRTTRQILKPFIGSNPTWIKKPHSKSRRLSPSKECVFSFFESSVRQMIDAIDGESYIGVSYKEDISCRIASSTNLPLENSTVDFILSSPPYCTRIDYAVATAPELAVLGYDMTSDFVQLRKKLIGTSMVGNEITNQNELWGNVCNDFLTKLKSHESKSSGSYYYKNHLHYFHAMYESIAEIGRVSKVQGKCILIVQDSYYKELHNDVPAIITDMMKVQKYNLCRHEAFSMRNSMAAINPKVRKYRQNPFATESVLCFSR